MLHLPDVTELVRHEVIRQVVGPQEDDPVQRVPIEAPEPGQAEEPRCNPEPDTVDPDGRRPPVQSVESRLGRCQPGIQR